MFDIKAVSDVQVSPDGWQVAFVVLERTKETKPPISHIWVVPAAGGEPRQLTRGPGIDTAPRWSPDGRTLAFLSDRAETGKLQLYLLPMEGGEAAPLTEVPGGIGGYRIALPGWSPDGRFIAFLAPEVDVEEEKRRQEERDAPLVVGQELKYVRLWVVDVVSGEVRQITQGELHVWDFAWSPSSDGWAVVATPTPDWEVRLLGPNNLLYLPIDGGQAVQLCQQQAYVANLRWSPDGRIIAFVSNEGRITSGGPVFTVPVEGGEPQRITLDYEGSIEWFDWGPGGDELFLSANEDVLMPVRRMPAAGGTARRATWQGAVFTVSERSPALSWSRDGETWACVREDGQHPAEVWVGQPDGPWRQATRFNAWVEALTLGETEHVRWPSADGWEVGGVLVKPVGYEPGRAYPLVVQLQGGPGWCWVDRFYADWRECAQHLAARGYAVLLPNPRGSAGRGRAFLDDFLGNPGAVQLQDILSGVDYLVKRGIADPERLGVGGFSWGGYMTAWTITQTDRFKAAVLGAAMVNWISALGQSDAPRPGELLLQADLYAQPVVFYQHSPITHIQNVRTPTLILQGAEDLRVPVGQARELHRALLRMGVETELVIYPRDGHVIQESRHQLDALERTLAWYDKHLGSERR